MRVVDSFTSKSALIEFTNGKLWILVVDGACNAEGLVVCVAGSIVDAPHSPHSFATR